MTDTTVTTEAPPPTPIPLPNDALARSPTGEILEPAQIAAQQTQTPPKAPEPKADGDPASTSTSKDPAAKTDGPPDTYADFTAPEGYTLDKAAIDAFVPVAKELGLSQEAAQKLVDFHSKQMIEAAKGPVAEYESTRNAWKAQVDSDPEIKGAVLDGKTGIDAVKIGIAKTLAAIGDPALTQEFKAAMNLTGVGDNPAFIKAMWKLSAYVTEGGHVAGAKPSPFGQTPPGQDARPSAAKAMYPNLPG